MAFWQGDEFLFSVIEDRNGKTGEFWRDGNGVYERAVYSSSKAAL